MKKGSELMATLNTNLTTSGGLSASVKTYYDKRLIDNMKPKLVHYEYAQKRPMPKNEGKTVSFRKWTPFEALTSPLSEGVVPNGQTLSMTEVTSTVAGYGGYVAISDIVDGSAVDPVASDAVDLMAEQGALSIDTIIRDILHAGTNVIYADNVASRRLLVATNVLSTDELRKAARLLKKNKAPMFYRNSKHFYVAIVGPDTVYDLQGDTTWQDVSKYQNSENIFSGEIGRIFGVVVVETPEAKLIEATDLTVGAAALTISSWTDGTKTLVVAEEITSADVSTLADRQIILKDDTDDVEYVATIASATAAGAGSATIILTQNQAAIGFTPAASDVIYPGEAGASGISVASTLIFGRDAYGVVSVEAMSNARAIVKPAGSAGTSDPLDQISTIGWKIDAFAAKVLQQSWLVRVEHGFTS